MTTQTEVQPLTTEGVTPAYPTAEDIAGFFTKHAVRPQRGVALDEIPDDGLCGCAMGALALELLGKTAAIEGGWYQLEKEAVFNLPQDWLTGLEHGFEGWFLPLTQEADASVDYKTGVSTGRAVARWAFGASA